MTARYLATAMALSILLTGCVGYVAHDPEKGTTVNILGVKVVDPEAPAGEAAEQPDG